MSKKSAPARGSQQTAAAITEVVPWSVPVTVDDIPDAGLHRSIEASEAVRAAIARLAEVHDVTDLTAAFDISRSGSKVLVTGRVHAKVGQTCVVSLEPMQTVVDEPIEVAFAPPPAGAVLAETEAGEPRRRTADDGPDPLIGNSIDLGALASEFLVLAIDPYPRKEGAEFTPPAVEEDDVNPFAALAALKNEPGNRKN